MGVSRKCVLVQRAAMQNYRMCMYVKYFDLKIQNLIHL